MIDLNIRDPNHGHVTARADGKVIKCGGVGYCAQCTREFNVKHRVDNPSSTIEQRHMALEKHVAQKAAERQALLDRERVAKK